MGRPFYLAESASLISTLSVPLFIYFMPAPIHYIYGFHAVGQRVQRAPSSVINLYVDEERQDARVSHLLQQAVAGDIKIIRVSGERIKGMVGTARHQGVVAGVVMVTHSHSPDDILDQVVGTPLVLALDGITDPHNLGACLRSAYAVGADLVLAPRDHAAGISAAVIKSSAGMAELIPYIMVTNLVRTLRELKERGLQVIGACQEAELNYDATGLEVPLVWVLGAEDKGLRRLTRETCDEQRRIPLVEGVDSLNVAVATGVCLFETTRQRRMLKA